MASDASHEFGEFMSAVIYIVIFALSIGIGMMAVKNTVKISGNYNVKPYLVVNTILSALKGQYNNNGYYYLPQEFLQSCSGSRKNFEECLNIHIPEKYIYYVKIIIPNSQTTINIGPKEGKTIYVSPILVDYKGAKTFAWMVIGVKS